MGARVEPLGEGLIWVLPDGFSPLFRPAAALPALLLMPVPAGLLVALPVVVPVWLIGSVLRMERSWAIPS